jgi:hypothetical protein
VITAAVVVISHAAIRWMVSLGWLDIKLTYNFEGSAGDRNAFALQMIICSITLVAGLSHQGKIRKHLRTEHSILSAALYDRRCAFFTFCHGAILAGLFFSASRAGIGTEVFLLAFSAIVLRWADRRMLLQSLFYALIIWMIFSWMLPAVSEIWKSASTAQSKFSSIAGASDAERWKTIQNAWEMWKSHPFLGAGLGVFLEKSILWHNRPIVVHCTPLWILAELGLLGAAILCAAFARIFAVMYRSCGQRAYPALPCRIAVLLLTAFAIFGLVHDIFYQRMFWLMLGVCLALPFRSSGSRNMAPDKKDCSI